MAELERALDAEEEEDKVYADLDSATKEAIRLAQRRRRLTRTRTLREDRDPLASLLDAKGRVLPYVKFARLEHAVQHNQSVFDKLIAELSALELIDSKRVAPSTAAKSK